MKLVSYCNKIIEYTYYAVFFLVPLVFVNNTSELFEFNKMWLTFSFALIIGTTWIIKMIALRRIIFNPTIFAIPMLAFLVSQIISSVFSLDQHVSWWGYYSRFNGGLLSTITYIFLYFAFASNFFNKEASDNPHSLIIARDAASMSKRVLVGSLLSGLIVALWGFPSHFGYDPTCFLFRGTFDTACWTDMFKPTVRVFSTLGQPAWFAAYLAVLLPITIIITLITANKSWRDKINKSHEKVKKQHAQHTVPLRLFNIKVIALLLLSILFYLDLIFANTRAGSVAFFIAEIFMWVVLFVKQFFPRRFILSYFLIFHALFFVSSFFFGMPLDQLNKYTYPRITSHMTQQKITPPSINQQAPAPSGGSSALADLSITDSGTIRLLVWKGAIEAWKAHPLFGTGVETFAFAYYLYRPEAHNLTSEWDYLYNKAHNEYLNYLATTGIFGLGSYLLIFGFLGYVILFRSGLFLPTKNTQPTSQKLLVLGVISGYISILISNFFGFSVVIINLYLFLFPALLLGLLGSLSEKQTIITPPEKIDTAKSFNAYQWITSILVVIICGYLLLGLYWYWYADTVYALGYNLDHVGSYQAYEQAYPQLITASRTEPNEPVYKDELSVNLAILATGYYMQKDATDGAQFAKNALALSTDVVTNHPNDVVFWKDRVRVLYSLGQVDAAHQGIYIQNAQQAIAKASELAPTDAKIWYNYGVLTGQVGDIPKGIQILQKTIAMKQNYRDAYYALGLFYHQQAIDKNNKVINSDLQQKAIDTYQYILRHIDPRDKDVKKSLQTWEVKSL